ncbi:antitermination protein [Erwinia sp. S63]|uniref:antiterminator Q family protein n=1 Tax=Erwinia sp. S63 TaxID=2769341 RepID=UPI00190B28C0|nr:antitermination protein [Erwinia sp. S63]
MEKYVGCSSISASFNGLFQDELHGIRYIENDTIIINSCVCRLRQKRSDENALLVEHYIKDISKRALERKLKIAEGILCIRFQIAEGIIVGGCRSILDDGLEMDG